MIKFRMPPSQPRGATATGERFTLRRPGRFHPTFKATAGEAPGSQTALKDGLNDASVTSLGSEEEEDGAIAMKVRGPPMWSTTFWTQPWATKICAARGSVIIGDCNIHFACYCGPRHGQVCYDTCDVSSNGSWRGGRTHCKSSRHPSSYVCCFPRYQRMKHVLTPRTTGRAAGTLMCINRNFSLSLNLPVTLGNRCGEGVGLAFSGIAKLKRR